MIYIIQNIFTNKVKQQNTLKFLFKFLFIPIFVSTKPRYCTPVSFTCPTPFFFFLFVFYFVYYVPFCFNSHLIGNSFWIRLRIRFEIVSCFRPKFRTFFFTIRYRARIEKFPESTLEVLVLEIGSVVHFHHDLSTCCLAL